MSQQRTHFLRKMMSGILAVSLMVMGIRSGALTKILVIGIWFSVRPMLISLERPILTRGIERIQTGKLTELSERYIISV